jgi:hypothetical protein
MEKQDPEDRYQQELLLSRKILKDQMRKAMLASSPTEKKALAAYWKETFSPDMARELLRVARDYDARARIANWNLESFEKDRRGARK